MGFSTLYSDGEPSSGNVAAGSSASKQVGGGGFQFDGKIEEIDKCIDTYLDAKEMLIDDLNEIGTNQTISDLLDRMEKLDLGDSFECTFPTEFAVCFEVHREESTRSAYINFQAKDAEDFVSLMVEVCKDSLSMSGLEAVQHVRRLVTEAFEKQALRVLEQARKIA